MSKKSHHFLTLWPWPLTYDLEKLIRSAHYHYQCVYQIWEQSNMWFLSYRVNTIAGGGRLRRKTITSPDPSDTGDIIISKLFSHNLGFILQLYVDHAHILMRDTNTVIMSVIIQISFGYEIKYVINVAKRCRPCLLCLRWRTAACGGVGGMLRLCEGVKSHDVPTTTRS